MASNHVRVPVPVYEKAKELKEDRDYSSLGEAIRAMVNDGGYDL